MLYEVLNGSITSFSPVPPSAKVRLQLVSSSLDWRLGTTESFLSLSLAETNKLRNLLKFKRESRRDWSNKLSLSYTSLHSFHVSNATYTTCMFLITVYRRFILFNVLLILKEVSDLLFLN